VSLVVDPTSSTPPSRQIVVALLDRLAGGHYGAGDRLPSVRGLAAEALVNPNTVGKAYRELESLGIVAGRNGAGVFVTARGPRLARRQRRAATLVTLQEAIRCALRAGHEIEALHHCIAEELGGAGHLAQRPRRTAS